MKSNAKVEFGDFQTPLALAREVCALLSQRVMTPETVLEPTCGVGAFLEAAAEAFPEARLLGFDINPGYVARAGSILEEVGATVRSSVTVADFFTHDWDAQVAATRGSLLVLGNLPWVTNAAVSAMNGSNLPAKQNFQGLRGIHARTGKSNFDISEWMLIRLLQALRGRRATVAMLCKTATARKLLRFAWQKTGQIASASLHCIDAKKHFGASVDACLLLAATGGAGPAEAPMFESLSARKASVVFGLSGKDLVFDLDTYRRLKHLEGLSPYQWRSGVKHDCASVMELRRVNGHGLTNKLGEHVDLESAYLFPLLKCSDLAHGRTQTDRLVLVTQRRVGEDTSTIAIEAPRTWRYLDSHRSRFEARKSSIYTNTVPFALFGIGGYTFAPWKIAVSALHRNPRFVVVGPENGKPAVFDDTCYFLPFEDEQEARIVAAILNSKECAEFLTSLTFTDSKRPITVDLLQRLNMHALAEDCGLAGEWSATRNRNACYSVTPRLRQAELVMDGAAGED